MKRHSLAIAICVALALKVVLLYGLWKAFFSHPQTKKMRLPTEQVEQHLLSAPPPVQLKPKVNDGTHR